MIWIRADANKEIGTGHVMRCLSVAAVLRKQGEAVLFLLADDSAAELLRTKGQEYVILNTSYGNMEEELPILERLAGQKQPDVCLVDSYFVTESYLRQLSGICKTAYMDDMNSFAYPVELVINYNIYGDVLGYEEKGTGGTRYLLGTRYVPLREEFCEVGAQGVRDCVEHVLITTGGSDKYNLAGRILEAVMSNPQTDKLHYHVVSGAFNEHLPELKDLEKENSRITIHQNVTKMSELMRMCDVAITAGGSTMYELCAMGVPILCFSFVENQEGIVRTFRERGLVCYGGNYLQEGEGLFQRVVDSLQKLMTDRMAREQYAKRQQELVDGQGATRIAGALCGMRRTIL